VGRIINGMVYLEFLEVRVMCEKHDTALEVLRQFVLENEKFEVKELLDHVYRRAGTTRIAPARDIVDWLQDAEEIGYIREIEPGIYERRLINL